MAFALQTGSDGRLARIGTGTALNVDSLERQSGSGNLVVGSTLIATEELRLGSTTALTRSMGDAQIDGLLVVTDGDGDTSPLLDINQTGANAGRARVFAGSRDPEGNVTANAGDYYMRDSGGSSSLYVFRGTDATNTGWRDLSVAGGSALTLEWDWSTDTTATDPGSGNVKGNNATQGSITALYISDVTSNGKNVDVVLDDLKSGDVLIITEEADSARWIIFELNGAPTDNTGWWTLPGTVPQNGTALRNGRTQAVQVILASDTGGDVNGPASSTDNAIARFDGTTGKLLQNSAPTIDDDGDIDMGDRDLRQVRTITSSGPETQTTSGATLTLNLTTGMHHRITLASNITTINITDPPGPGHFTIEFIQNGTGSFTVAGWPANVFWGGGTAPTFGDAANSRRLVSLYYNGATEDDYYGEYRTDTYS